MSQKRDHKEDAEQGVDRRGFLRGGLAAGAALVTAKNWAARTASPAASAVDSVGGEVGAAAGAAAGAAPVPSFELDELTIAELQNGLATGRFTARRLTELYLARIEEIDRRGPQINSIIELNPDALAIADALDAERKAKGPRGPLHGVPVVIKDNIDTADRMHTSAGSLALADSIPPRDSFLAERLRAAGAVILGKTNLSEWANFRSSHSSSGWSGRGGQTRNPYALDRNPCGSSSGTGVAISANLAAAGVGTETDGSIMCPSNANGLVGIKPTVGLLSRAGVIPISATQDTPGPMCRTVADAAILLGAMAGADPRDPATSGARGAAPQDYRKYLDPGALEGARLGVARKLFNAGPHVDRLMEDVLKALKSAGADLVDPAEIPHVGEYDDAELEVLLYEFKDGLNAYLASLGPHAPHRMLAELIRFNKEHAAAEMPFFGQEFFEQAEAKGPLSAPAYRAALKKCRRLSRKHGIDAGLKQHRVHAFIAPTGGLAWLTDWIDGDHFSGGSSTPAAVAGYPSISVPAGQIFGLPIGLTFIGAAWSEPQLIRFAYAFEQATHARRAPKFLPTADLRP